MIPLLTYPLALVAIAALPALAAIYFWRNRFRRHTVSSVIFWRLQARVKEGGAKVDRLQLPLVFFLELLTLVLLVCAATGPRWQLPVTIRPLIVVLDNSLSMKAGAGTEPPRQQAERALRQLLQSRKFRSSRIVLAGQRPRTVSVVGETTATWQELLSGWTCDEPAADLDSAIVLAIDIGRREAEVLVLTDHAPANQELPDARLCWWAFGKNQPNVAFINARRSAFGREDRCLFEVANYAPQPQVAEITLTTGTNQIHQARLELAPGRSEKLIVNVPAHASPLIARLPDDALAADNQVLLVSPPRRQVQVQTTLTNSLAAEWVSRALEATGLLAPAHAVPDLIIHQSARNLSVSNAWDLRLVSEESATTYTGPFVVDSAHPLAQGLNLNGVLWAGSAVTNHAAVPIISAGNVPLLTAQEDVLGRQHLTLFLNPGLSTLPTSPNWPVLFWNLLSWRLAHSPGLKECNLRLGAEVEFTTREGTARVIGPDLNEKSLTARANPLIYQPEHPGLHLLVTGTTTNLLAVNALSPEESNLTHGVSGRWGHWQSDREVRYEYESVLWIFLLTALAVLTVHLIALHRGKTSA